MPAAGAGAGSADATSRDPDTLMDLQITGEVTRILPEESGTGRNGPWRKQGFILKTPGDYPREVCVIQWGENIDKFAVRAGETLTAYIDVQSREYNGRWYTDVKAWKVERPDGAAPPRAEAPPLDEPPPGFDEDDPLPF